MGNITKGPIGNEDIEFWDGTSTKTFTRATSTGGTLTLTKVGSEVDALISYGGGVNYTQATTEAALAAIGTADKVSLLLRPGTWVISSNADWSAYTNVTLKLVPGAILQIATGITLTLPNTPDAGDYQIFSCVGTGVVSGLKYVNPTWFGLSTSATGANNQIYLTQAIAALTAGGEIKFTSASSYTVIGNWTINKSANIYFNGSTLNFSSDAASQGILATTSNVNFYQPILTGPQYAAHNSTQRAIYAHGTSNAPLAPTYLTNINVYGGKITNWGRTAIKLQYVKNTEITGVNIEDIYFSGISLSSVENFKVHHNWIQDITGVVGSSAYGIAATKETTTGTDATTDPPSKNGSIDHNYVYNVPQWEGIDTHGGGNIIIDDNIVIDCHLGIMMCSVADTDGNQHQLKHTKARGNIVVTTLTDPSYGIADGGNLAGRSEYIEISGNYVSGHGHESGAIYSAYSTSPIISNNQIYNPGAYGIYLVGSSNFSVTGNIIDGMKADHATASISVDNVGTPSGIIANNIIDCNGVAPYGINNGYTTTYADITISGNQVKNPLTLAYKGFYATNWDRYISNSDGSTSAAGEDELKSRILYQDQFADLKGLRIIAAGTKTNSNGNKTLKLYLGSSSFTFNAAANDTNDWRVEATIWFTGAATQRVTWLGWNGATPLQGYEAWTEDISAGALTLKLTGECAHSNDVITQTIFEVTRLGSN